MPQGMEAPDASMGEDGGKTLAYCVEVYVYADGTFRVTKEAPEAEEAEHEAAGTEEGAGGQDFQSLGEALKGVLDIIKQNPVSGGAQSQFEAGLRQESPSTPPMGGKPPM